MNDDEHLKVDHLKVFYLFTPAKCRNQDTHGLGYLKCFLYAVTHFQLNAPTSIINCRARIHVHNRFTLDLVFFLPDLQVPLGIHTAESFLEGDGARHVNCSIKPLATVEGHDLLLKESLSEGTQVEVWIRILIHEVNVCMYETQAAFTSFSFLVPGFAQMFRQS